MQFWTKMLWRLQWSCSNDESKWCVKLFTRGYGLYKVVVSTESIFFKQMFLLLYSHFTWCFSVIFGGWLGEFTSKVVLISKAQARGWLYSIEIVIISASELLDSLSQCNQICDYFDRFQLFKMVYLVIFLSKYQSWCRFVTTLR